MQCLSRRSGGEGGRGGGGERGYLEDRRAGGHRVWGTVHVSHFVGPLTLTRSHNPGLLHISIIAVFCPHAMTPQEPRGGHLVPEGQLHPALHARRGAEAGLPLQRVDPPPLHLHQRV